MAPRKKSPATPAPTAEPKKTKNRPRVNASEAKEPSATRQAPPKRVRPAPQPILAPALPSSPTAAAEGSAPKRPKRAPKKAAAPQLPPTAADIRPSAPETLVHAPANGTPSHTADAPPSSAVRIFQAFQESWQKDLLDPGFTGMDQSRQTAELPELTLPKALLEHEATHGVALWGVVSWRFTEQTGMTGADLRNHLVQHPGADVYHCNPSPADEAVFHNAWLEGETTHPGFLGLARAALEAAQLNPQATLSMEASPAYGAGLIVAASHAFWAAYLPFIEQFVRQTRLLGKDQRVQLVARIKDDHALLSSGSMLEMLVRRLLPLFLMGPGKAFKAQKIALPEKERALNVHLQLLREMKDVAHRSQSSWLAACWVNYRNLYLNQSKGKAWCQQHLRNITPSDIRFAPTV